MRITVRPSAFETNSSSTHSLVVLSRDRYDEWKTGHKYLDLGVTEYRYEDVAVRNPRMVDRDEAYRLYEERSVGTLLSDDYLVRENIVPYDLDKWSFSTFIESYREDILHDDEVDMVVLELDVRN